MKAKFLIPFTLMFVQCGNVKTHKEESSVAQDTTTQEVNLTGIYQLDYYPDSILYYRDIDKYSNGCTSYAYDVEFTKDSCQFTGWNESFGVKVTSLGGNEFRAGDTLQYWEFIFLPDQKLKMRENYKRKDSIERSEYYLFHRVNKVLTQEELEDRMAKEVFEGKYRVLFNDTLECDSIIYLGKNYNVKGVKGRSKYYFETEIDIDYPVPNYFAFRDTGNNGTELSFSFSGDTLLLKKFDILNDEEGDFSGFKVADTKVKLLKVK